ncbi:unnamed protein product [Durusdinium trenchii]|uniref:Zinc finger CCCH domain-containing protein 5 (OsC3H5) (Zinc finger CCCH domain-containing protein ZFN-like 3) n=2 Tax=Durusdinium trenchii TaxID=1381693 RepID=A0ABP0M9H4_9DINO
MRPRQKKRWQLELEGELAGDSEAVEAPAAKADAAKAKTHQASSLSRSRSPPGCQAEVGHDKDRVEKVEAENEKDDGEAKANGERPTRQKAYAWMDSGDEGSDASRSGSREREPEDRGARSRSPSPAAVEPADVQTLPQMLRLAEVLSKRPIKDLCEPRELCAVCAAAARVKFYDLGLFEILGPALKKCFQMGLEASDAKRFSLSEALDVLRALTQLNAAKSLSMVFTAAIKAIEAELRGGGSLDATQRKFLRETYTNAGREEDVAFLSKLRNDAGPPASTKEGLNSAGLPMRPGARICEVFAKSGTCRVGTTCRFDHPEGMKVTFNSEGFPLRPWASVCPYYMSMGTCDFKRNCKWHHPDKRDRAAP